MIFLGFKSWYRDPENWSHTDESWGLTMASWAAIGAFFLLVLIVSFIVGENPFRKTRALEAEALEGIAPSLGPKEVIHSDWKRSWMSILDAL